MEANKNYLKGKSVFIISLIVVVLTILTVYLTGINYHRSLTSNLYISLGIIAFFLFLFMFYGLYAGIGLVDNFPKYRDFKRGDYIASSGTVPDMQIIDAGDGIGGIIFSILLWIGLMILFIVLLIVLEAAFWISIFIILSMLYWIFIRALRMVFKQSVNTKGDIIRSAFYSLFFTLLYSGWIFGIVYLTQVLK